MHFKFYLLICLFFFSPGISFFVCLNANNVEDNIFAAIHDAGFDAETNLIKQRNHEDDTKQAMLSCLKSVVKVSIFIKGVAY